MGIERRLALVLGDPLLNHAVRHGDDLVHGGIEPLPRFWAFDVFRFGLHTLMMPQLQQSSAKTAGAYTPYHEILQREHSGAEGARKGTMQF